ncbi:LacI family DNA-binding transcriptional regulator [Sphingomonas astaxanthinifaciens]|uniref:LacI family transcriptional regulator n=1 Tax=Sphingomonas astaxanthinifaciens DSM 22298 TaxID=1123267 RepID=A0ABQ5Z6E4_9SPHN|nr:LacI family DNA-binding transcriptional regulator [Sphingomonas astaxanthinifaciens]GLR48343.1 LacI family transcriptional regulator [Sphingomonas astaxanthinifaciens DSM 22298]
MEKRAGDHKRNVTIDDVAALAGVSRQTVSRVINRSPNVRDSVRERIEQAIEQLGYVANLSARRMGGGKSFLILAINDKARTIENWSAGRGNDWVDQMLFGGMTECQKHGFHMSFELVDTEPDQARKQLSDIVAALRPDGVILTPPHSDNPELLELLERRAIPCGRIARSEGGAFVDVYMDEEGAAYEASRHLLRFGHRRIAFLSGNPTYANARARLAGFRRALAEEGLGESAAVTGSGDFHFERAEDVVSDWLSAPNPPTAIIADNDEMAHAALHVARRNGLAVPSDLSVISFEDTPGVRFTLPPLTAIRQPTAEMFAKACERLITVSGGGDGLGAYAVPFTLVVRDSTGPAPE